MTTYLPFTPSNSRSPPFLATITLDGSTYALAVKWSIYRQDWYFSLSTRSGAVVFYGALIGSPPNSNIYLAPGLFNKSTLLFRPSTGNFEIGP